MILALLAVALLIAGALLLYASTRHQALLAKPASRRAGLMGGGLVLGALVTFEGVAGPATAVFIWLTGLMLLWSLIPILAKWIRWKVEARR